MNLTEVDIREQRTIEKYCLDYLLDAGFTMEMFEFKYNEIHQDVEFTFDSDEAIDYILQDLKKSLWNKILKAYKAHHKICFYEP